MSWYYLRSRSVVLFHGSILLKFQVAAWSNSEFPLRFHYKFTHYIIITCLIVKIFTSTAICMIYLTHNINVFLENKSHKYMIYTVWSPLQNRSNCTINIKHVMNIHMLNFFLLLFNIRRNLNLYSMTFWYMPFKVFNTICSSHTSDFRFK